VVLEELDRAKKGLSEVSRNVRQATRFMDELMTQATADKIREGLPLDGGIKLNLMDGNGLGRLYFQTEQLPNNLPNTLPGNTPDNSILATALQLQEERPETQLTLVSKDINLRIKATVLGIHAEDYYNDQVLDDVNLLFSGTMELQEDFWDHHGRDLESWQQEGRTFYRITGPEVENWYANQFLYRESDAAFQCIVRKAEAKAATVELITDYQSPNHKVWGIHARNREQNFALNLLMDPQIDFVSLLGVAGTGKTLLTLAAALTQTLDDRRYREIIMTRATVPLGEDIGFLPGTEEEKMTPWMGALLDNLEVLTQPDEGGSWGRAATNDLLQSRIKVRSLNFMRGRTFLNKFIIIDEAQNLTAKQMKTLVTRAGPGTKVVCLGNIGQIDTPYLTETSSGLTYVVDRFKQWDHSGHVTLRRGERSRLAEHATEVL